MSNVVLTDDSWKAAYLLSCLVTDRDCGAPSQEPTPDNARLEVTYYDPQGQLARSSTRDSIIGCAHSATKDRVQEYLHETEPFYGFMAHRIWAKLTPRFASELVADLRSRGSRTLLSGYNSKVKAVMSGLCALSGDDEVYDGGRSVQHILYFEPNDDLAPQAAQEMVPVPAAEAICAYFDAAERTATPAIVEDVLLLPEIGFGNPSYACVAVRLAPYRDEGGLQIPLVPIQILNRAAACRIKSTLAHELNSLPISGNGYWDMFKTMKSFRRYSRDYMTQRTDAEKLIQRSSEASRAMEDRFPTWLLNRRYEEFADFPEVRSKHGWWTWRTVKNLLQQRMMSADTVHENALKRVVERTRVLDEFLRDAALADVSDTNLKLARSVRYLSWIVLFVSVIGLVLGALPDSRKSALLDRLVGVEQGPLR